MPEVNPITVRAQEIAEKLDAQDGRTDNKISKSIWDEFVADKGGKPVDEFISVKDAVKSITTYLRRIASSMCMSTDELADEWMKKADEPSLAKDKINTKVTVPDDIENRDEVQALFDKAMDILVEIVNTEPFPTRFNGNGREGQYKFKLADGSYVAIAASSSGDMYAISIGMPGHTLAPVFIEFGHYTCKASYNIDNQNDDKEGINYEGSFNTGLNFENIKKIGQRIMEKSSTPPVVDKDQKAKDLEAAKITVPEDTEHRQNIQKTIDKGLDLITTGANFDRLRRSMQEGHDNTGYYKQLMLSEDSNHIWVRIYVDSEGNPARVTVSLYCFSEADYAANIYKEDFVEVSFDADKVLYKDDYNSSNWAGSITGEDGYSFDKIKELAKRILDKNS